MKEYGDHVTIRGKREYVIYHVEGDLYDLNRPEALKVIWRFTGNSILFVQDLTDEEKKSIDNQLFDRYFDAIASSDG